MQFEPDEIQSDGEVHRDTPSFVRTDNGDCTGYCKNNIQRFLTSMPHRLSVGKGKTALNGILVEVDDDTGRALSIERIYREVEE